MCESTSVRGRPEALRHGVGGSLACCPVTVAPLLSVSSAGAADESGLLWEERWEEMLMMCNSFTSQADSQMNFAIRADFP